MRVLLLVQILFEVGLEAYLNLKELKDIGQRLMLGLNFLMTYLTPQVIG